MVDGLLWTLDSIRIRVSERLTQLAEAAAYLCRRCRHLNRDVLAVRRAEPTHRFLQRVHRFDKGVHRVLNVLVIRGVGPARGLGIPPASRQGQGGAES